MEGGWEKFVLIIFGPGGWGKTEFACALMHSVAPAKRFHFLNRIDRLRETKFAKGEGLILDEVCFADRCVDDVKGLLDLAKTRSVQCRNKDGVVPKGTPRIFTTNWSWEAFWPREAFQAEHLVPIKRRILWVEIDKDLRVLGSSAGPELTADQSARIDRNRQEALARRAQRAGGESAKPQGVATQDNQDAFSEPPEEDPFKFGLGLDGESSDDGCNGSQAQSGP